MQALRDFVYDLRFALRSLRASTMVTATIVLCLGVGIGATGTAYAWLESVILHPLPAVSDVGRLVSLKITTASGDTNLSYPDYRDVARCGGGCCGARRGDPRGAHESHHGAARGMTTLKSQLSSLSAET